jgi:glyoxylase-like metal-dependent hydrolase (beta-lactamase superfamily II)
MKTKIIIPLIVLLVCSACNTAKNENALMEKCIRLDLGITKVYLLPCINGYLLIDTGYENDYEKFLSELSNRNIKTEEIKYLLLTHYHDDHVGFAQKLKDTYRIPLLVQRKSIELLKTGDSGNAEKDFPANNRIKFIMWAYMLVHKDFQFPAVTVTDDDIIIDEDDEQFLKSIGINGTILYTPGHTGDHMVVALENGNVFCGDAAMNFLRFAGIKHRPIYMTDRQAVYRSWEKILANGAQYIFPAHGDPFPAENLSENLKKFIKKGEYIKSEMND